MALKNKGIATANPGVVANANYINALYKETYGRNATKAELTKFANYKVSDAANYILGAKVSPFYPGSANYIAPKIGATNPTVAPPEDLGTLYNRAEEAATPEQERSAYESMVNVYGIRNPQMENDIYTKRGLPIPDLITSIDLNKGIIPNALALDPQQYRNTMDSLDAAKTQAIAGWQNLKDRIGTGELDPNGQEYQDIAGSNGQLAQMTQAIQTTKQSLSASGNYFGGAYAKQLGNAQIDPNTGRVISGKVGQALQSYVGNIQNLHSQYGYQRSNAQTDYNTAMTDYLGGTKSAQEKYGLNQPETSAGANEYGGGTWNPQTGTYENIQWGMTKAQASAAKLGFIGSNAYDVLQSGATDSKTYYDTLLNKAKRDLAVKMGYSNPNI